MLITLLISAVLLSMSAASAAGLWKGITWDDPYGTSTVNGSDQLVVTTSGSFSTCPTSCLGAAHYNTPQPFRDADTPWVKATFIDDGPGTPGPRMWMEDEDAGALTTFGGLPTFPNYRIFLWNYGAAGSQINFDTGVPRIAGVHEILIGMGLDGSIDYLIDGVHVLHTTDITPGYFGDIYLTGNSDVASSTVVFTNYQVGTDWVAPDSDADGVLDADDACPGTPSEEPVDENGCGASQLGSIEVRKYVFDDGRFNLLIDSEVYAENVGFGGSTGEVPVATGEHTVSEAAAEGTDLDDYHASVFCRDSDGDGLIVASSLQSGTVVVDVGPADDIVCTIVNLLTPRGWVTHFIQVFLGRFTRS